MLSPIPPLGQAHYGHGQSSRNEAGDKAKFMQKMSEMYDRAGRASSSSAHNAQKDCGCMSAEDVERRFRERDAEIVMLKDALAAFGREMVALRGLLSGAGASRRVDGDGDVSMAAGGVAPTSTAPTANDMEVDTRSGIPANQFAANGDAIPSVSFKNHRKMASRTQNSLSDVGVTSERSSSIIPIPPAVPSIPKVPIAAQNGNAASTTPSPSSSREDTPTAGMNGVEAAPKPPGKSGESEGMKA